MPLGAVHTITPRAIDMNSDVRDFFSKLTPVAAPPPNPPTPTHTSIPPHPPHHPPPPPPPTPPTPLPPTPPPPPPYGSRVAPGTTEERAQVTPRMTRTPLPRLRQPPSSIAANLRRGVERSTPVLRSFTEYPQFDEGSGLSSMCASSKMPFSCCFAGTSGNMRGRRTILPVIASASEAIHLAASRKNGLLRASLLAMTMRGCQNTEFYRTFSYSPIRFSPVPELASNAQDEQC